LPFVESAGERKRNYVASQAAVAVSSIQSSFSFDFLFVRLLSIGGWVLNEWNEKEEKRNKKTLIERSHVPRHHVRPGAARVVPNDGKAWSGARRHPAIPVIDSTAI
jgi:hypothetical protein